MKRRDVGGVITKGIVQELREGIAIFVSKGGCWLGATQLRVSRCIGR